MKCPSCWAEKAYRRAEDGVWARVLRCLGCVPMRCRHCFHKFWTHRLLTLGTAIDPPARLHAVAPPDTPSLAARHVARPPSDEPAPSAHPAAVPQPVRRRAA